MNVFVERSSIYSVFCFGVNRNDAVIDFDNKKSGESKIGQWGDENNGAEILPFAGRVLKTPWKLFLSQSIVLLSKHSFGT